MNAGAGSPRARSSSARRRRPLLALALSPLSACSYFAARLDDLHDCVLYRWHPSALGVAATAKVGPLDATVGGWYAELGQGKDTWWQRPGYVLTNHGTGVPFTTLSPLFYGTSWSRLFATGSSGPPPAAPDSFDDVRSWLCVSDAFDLDDNAPFRLTPQRRIADLFGVELGVVPVFVGLHIGFNVAEFADFLLGFACLDVFADDGRPRPPTLPYVPIEPRPAPPRAPRLPPFGR